MKILHKSTKLVIPTNTCHVPNSMRLSELPSSHAQPKPLCFSWNLNLEYQLCLYTLIHLKKKEKKHYRVKTRKMLCFIPPFMTHISFTYVQSFLIIKTPLVGPLSMCYTMSRWGFVYIACIYHRQGSEWRRTWFCFSFKYRVTLILYL